MVFVSTEISSAFDGDCSTGSTAYVPAGAWTYTLEMFFGELLECKLSQWIAYWISLKNSLSIAADAILVLSPDVPLLIHLMHIRITLYV